MKGFSLLELVVVIAIVGILAAIAVPTYNTNAMKANIDSVIPVIDKILRDSFVIYQTTGTFPASTTVNGVAISTNTWTWVGSTSGIGGFTISHPTIIY